MTNDFGQLYPISLIYFLLEILNPGFLSPHFNRPYTSKMTIIRQDTLQ